MAVNRLAFLGGVLFSFAAVGGLRAGAALEKITPPVTETKPVYMAGFGMNRVATAVMDDLYSRCLAISSDSDPVVICAVDSIGLFWDDVLKIRTSVAAQFNRPVSVIVSATHTHQGPDTLGLWGPKKGVSGIDESYNAFVIERTAAAAVSALKRMKGARMHLAKTHPPELDAFIEDNRPPVLHDAEMVLMRLTRRGRTIATLINWANHPEALGSSNTQLTPDFPAALARETESRLGGITIFVNGALGGMQSPLGAKVRDPRYGEYAPPETRRFMDAIGAQLADIALDAIRSAPPAKAGRMSYVETLVQIPVSNEALRQAAKTNLFGGRKALNADGTVTAPVGLFRIVEKKGVLLEAAAIPGEMYPELSVGSTVRYPEADFPDAPIEKPVKRTMTARYRMVFGLANDEIGYILPKAGWDARPPHLNGASKAWYGESNSLGPEAAPRIAEAFEKLAGAR